MSKQVNMYLVLALAMKNPNPTIQHLPTLTNKGEINIILSLLDIFMLYNPW